MPFTGSWFFDGTAAHTGLGLICLYQKSKQLFLSFQQFFSTVSEFVGISQAELLDSVKCWQIAGLLVKMDDVSPCACAY